MKHDTWIDNIKIFACILVVVGHFVQSMVASGIYPQSFYFDLFNQSIYSFHVPLFFICSGYLYQKRTVISSTKEWFIHVQKKMVNLGIPYFFFSLVTWLFKSLFSNDVNTQAAGLFRCLFVEPLSPYWYLYCLFFLFILIRPCKQGSSSLLLLLICFVAKLYACFYHSDIYLLTILFTYGFWFVLGMCLSFVDLNQYWHSKASLLIGFSSLFLFVCYVALGQHIWHEIESFLLGIVACCSFLSLFGHYCSQRSCRTIRALCQYTFPVFLMHTLFAAPVRIILFKLSLHNAALHTLLGLTASFLGPMLAYSILNTNSLTSILIKPQNIFSIIKKN